VVVTEIITCNLCMCSKLPPQQPDVAQKMSSSAEAASCCLTVLLLNLAMHAGWEGAHRSAVHDSQGEGAGP
jgi:hypothetical protein